MADSTRGKRIWFNLFSFGNAIADSFVSSFGKSVAVGTGVANTNSTAISSGNAILKASGTADANSLSLGNGRKAVFIVSPLNCWVSADRVAPAFVEFWSLINGSTNSSKLDYWVSIIQISPDFLAFKIIVGKNVVLCIIEGF